MLDGFCKLVVQAVVDVGWFWGNYSLNFPSGCFLSLALASL
jgi:hypothetical protein